MGSWGAGKPGWEAKLWEAKMASQTRNFEGGQHPNECRANVYDAALRTAENCIEFRLLHQAALSKQDMCSAALQ